MTINEVPTSHGPGDTELIMATRAGDTAAFGDLYGRHAPVAASRTKSRTENDTPGDQPDPRATNRDHAGRYRRR